jgi:CRP-like cAMP-binding protein
MFRKQTFSEGETITVEGSINHGFYIIDSGEVEVSMMTRSGSPKIAGVLGPGQSFGRLGLSHKEPSASSVKAKTNVTVWIVDAPTFHRYAETTRKATPLNEKPTYQDQLVKFIRNQEIFSSLSEKQIQELARSFFRVPTQEGDLLTRQGFMGDFYYIVQEGDYEVYVARPGKIPKLVDNIRPGGSFGSLSLLYNNPRAATVKCKKAGAVWVLDRQTFLKYAGPGPSYVQDAFEKYASVTLANQKFMTPEDFLKAVSSTVILFSQRHL